MSKPPREPVRPVFAAEGFAKRFGETEVLRAASVQARPGRVTVLLGRNGSGKSTLLRCALGLLRADNGSVMWRGRATLRPRLGRMARQGLFFLPSGPLAVPRRRVRAHMVELRAAFSGPHSAAQQDPLHVVPLAHSRIRQLSGGERRRVELTLALLRDPVCLIADEPLAGLAPVHQTAAVRALRATARAGAAVVVTGHDVEMLRTLADEVVWVVAAGTRVLGTPEEAWAHPEFARYYLGRGRRAAARPAEAVPPPAAAVGTAADSPPRAPRRARPSPGARRRRPRAWVRRARRVWLPVAAHAAVIWAVIRGVMGIFGRLGALAAESAAASSSLAIVPSSALVATCVFLAWVDRRRRGDPLWLANLGMEPRMAIGIGVATCLALEGVLATASWAVP